MDVNETCSNQRLEIYSASPSVSQKHRGPNYFIALQVKSANILENFRSLQEYVIDQEQRLTDACVPVEKSHVTLGVFYAKEDSLKAVEGIVEQAVSDYRSLYNTQIHFQLQGLGHFNHKVLFAKLNFSDVQMEKQFLHLWKLVTEKLFDAGFMKKRDAEVNLSKSHVTLMKLSLLKNLKGVNRIPQDLYDGHQDDEFGESFFTTVQILSMSKPKDVTTGYYHCEREFDLCSEDCKNEKSFDSVATLRQEKIDARSMIKDAMLKKTT